MSPVARLFGSLQEVKIPVAEAQTPGAIRSHFRFKPQFNSGFPADRSTLLSSRATGDQPRC
jgi:hypothetical protein